ncbi:hypothetical protein [Pseudomonas brassicacearum]|uniref:Uncharacterized protein n=1 Tax=Pseudomonas brassicacearum TaxID=930166 RepID=A0AAJ3FXN0_9PSED|nr:hypothetical protein [Pseudomonas brassicacearum]NUT81780.1 hypothetical protein [Pseudomonas brassicacearum]
MELAAWVVVLFFAVSWSAGVIINPPFRVKATIAALMHWWVLIITVALTGVSVFHLLWLMPLVIILCTIVMQIELQKLRAKVTSIFVKSAILIWPVTFFLVQAGR